MRRYTNTLKEVDEYLEGLIDEGFVINALKNYYQNEPEYNRLYEAVGKLKGERNMLLYPFTDYNINEYEEFMFGENSPVEHYVKDNALYAVMNSDMEFYLENNWDMIQIKNYTDTKELFYVDEYGKEYAIPYIEQDDQVVLVITDTYKLENKDETMKWGEWDMGYKDYTVKNDINNIALMGKAVESIRKKNGITFKKIEENIMSTRTLQDLQNGKQVYTGNLLNLLDYMGTNLNGLYWEMNEIREKSQQK